MTATSPGSVSSNLLPVGAGLVAVTHSSEVGHWYTRSGEPAYTIKGKNGQERPTTLRDARKLGLLPSVTTIIRCADRPGLTNWMIDQAILSALTLPRKDGEAESAWIARVKQDSKEQARKAAERGTAIHAAIQGHYEGIPPAEEYLRHVQGAANAVDDWFGSGAAWFAEKSFSSPIGFGGKVDLSSDLAVLDFKTKEFTEPESLKTWDEHAMQLAAYRLGLSTPQARCAICYVSTTAPGLAKTIEIPEAALQRGWQCFEALLDYWQAKNNYWPVSP